MENNEWQFVSLELAKKMKELGFPQESLFYWNFYDSPEEPILDYIDSCPLRYMEELVSAYTGSEVIRWLPSQIQPDKAITPLHLEIWKSNEDHYEVDYTSLQPKEQRIGETNESLANGAAKQLIYLAENGLLDVKTLTNK